MAAREASTGRGAGWLLAAVAAVCAAALAAIWMVQEGGRPSADTTAGIPSPPPGIEGRIATVPKWVTPAAGTDAEDERDPEAPVSGEGGDVSDPARGLLGVVLVEADRGADKASVAITNGTALLMQRGGETVRATPDDLERGSRVRVWYSGPVAESFPVQAVAGTVLILSADR